MRVTMVRCSVKSSNIKRGDKISSFCDTMSSSSVKLKERRRRPTRISRVKQSIFFVITSLLAVNIFSSTAALKSQHNKSFQVRREETLLSPSYPSPSSARVAPASERLAQLRAAPIDTQYLSGSSYDTLTADFWRHQQRYFPDYSSSHSSSLLNEKPTLFETVRNKTTPSCTNLNSGFYADKNSDCRSYWYCNERGQVQDVFECPHRLAFDEASRECKPASTFECSSIINMSTSSLGLLGGYPTAADTANQFVLLKGLSSKNGDKSSALLQPTIERKIPTGNGPVNCSDSNRGFFVVPNTGCRKYIYCALTASPSTTQQRTLEFECPTGTLFNTANEACESAREFTCPLEVDVGGTSFFPTPTSGSFTANARGGSGATTKDFSRITARPPTMSTGLFFCQLEDAGRNFANHMDSCVTYWSCLRNPSSSSQLEVTQKIQLCPPDHYYSNRQQNCTYILAAEEAQACDIPVSKFEERLQLHSQQQQQQHQQKTSPEASGGGLVNVTDFCQNRPRGLWPDAASGCHVYYYCTAGGSKTYQFSCPDDLIFIARLQACETPTTRLKQECSNEILQTSPQQVPPALLLMNTNESTLTAAASESVFHDAHPAAKYRSSQRPYNLFENQLDFGNSLSKMEKPLITSTSSYGQLNQGPKLDSASTSNGLVPDRIGEAIIINPQKVVEMQTNGAQIALEPTSFSSAVTTNHRVCPVAPSSSASRVGYAVESNTACRAYWECNGPEVASRRFVCPEGYAFDIEDTKRCLPSDLVVCTYGSTNPIITNPGGNSIANLAGVATEDFGRKGSKALKSWDRFDCRHKSGYYADYALGCQIFYYCYLNATKLTLACPQGMLFDENAQNCMSPSLNGPLSDQPTCTNPPLPKLVSPAHLDITTDGKYLNTKSTGSSIKSKKYTKLQCPHNVRGYFADPAYGCRRYWLCTSDGRKREFYDCPGTLLFNASTGACDPASNAVCADPLTLDGMFPGFLRRIAQAGNDQASLLMPGSHHRPQWNNNFINHHHTVTTEPQRFPSNYPTSTSNNMIMQVPGQNNQQMPLLVNPASTPMKQTQQYFPQPDQQPRHSSSAMMSPLPSARAGGMQFTPQMELGPAGMAVGGATPPLAQQLASMLANVPASSSVMSRASLPMGTINQHHLSAAALASNPMNPFAEMFGLIAKCEPKQVNGFFSDPDSGCRNFYYCDGKGNRVNNFSCPHHLLFNEKLTQCQKPVDALSFCAKLVDVKKGVPVVTPAPEKEIEPPEAEGALVPLAPAGAAGTAGAQTGAAAGTSTASGAAAGQAAPATSPVGGAAPITGGAGIGTPLIANMVSAPVCRGRTGYVADVDSACSQYYFCYPNGTAISHTCPAAMIFSEQASQCDWRSRVSHCGVSGLAVGPSPYPYISSRPTGSPYEMLMPSSHQLPTNIINNHHLNMPLYDASGSTLSFSVALPPSSHNNNQQAGMAEVPYYNTNPGTDYHSYGPPQQQQQTPGGSPGGSPGGPPPPPAISALEGISLSAQSNAAQQQNNNLFGAVDLNGIPLSSSPPGMNYNQQPPPLQNTAAVVELPVQTQPSPYSRPVQHQHTAGEGLVLPPHAKAAANSQLPDSATPPSTQEQEAVDFEGPAAAGAAGGAAAAGAPGNHNLNLVAPATRGAAFISGRVVSGSVSKAAAANAAATRSVIDQNAHHLHSVSPSAETRTPARSGNNRASVNNNQIIPMELPPAAATGPTSAINTEPLYGPYSASKHLPEPLGPDVFGGPNSVDNFLPSTSSRNAAMLNDMPPKTYERLRMARVAAPLTLAQPKPNPSTSGTSQQQQQMLPAARNRHNPPPFSSSPPRQLESQHNHQPTPRLLAPPAHTGYSTFSEPKRYSQHQPSNAVGAFVQPLPVHVRPDFALHSAPGPHNAAPGLAPQQAAAPQPANGGEAAEAIEPELEGAAALLAAAFPALDPQQQQTPVMHRHHQPQQQYQPVMSLPLMLGPAGYGRHRSASSNIDYRSTRRNGFLASLIQQGGGQPMAEFLS